MNSMIRSVLLFLLLVPLALAFLGPLKANFAFSSSSRSGGLFASTTTNTAIEQKKANLVALLEGVQPNGVYATAEQRKAVDTAARELERLNPTVGLPLSPPAPLTDRCHCFFAAIGLIVAEKSCVFG
eukprot:scaffold1551_cov164-Ochromonas_danica.AAC.8